MIQLTTDRARHSRKTNDNMRVATQQGSNNNTRTLAEQTCDTANGMADSIQNTPKSYAHQETCHKTKRKPRCRHLQRGFCLKAEILFLRTKRYYSIGTLKGTAGKPAAL